MFASFSNYLREWHIIHPSLYHPTYICGIIQILQLCDVYFFCYFLFIANPSTSFCTLLRTAYHTFAPSNKRPITCFYETVDKILIFGLVVFQLCSAEPWDSADDIQGFRQHISFILKLLNIILIISNCILQIFLPIFMHNLHGLYLEV